MQRITAKCSERCGWTGAVTTGWVDCDEGWAERAKIPQELRRWRGRQLQYRRRLRDGRCPGCGVRGLDRCERLNLAAPAASLTS